MDTSFHYILVTKPSGLAKNFEKILLASYWLADPLILRWESHLTPPPMSFGSSVRCYWFIFDVHTLGSYNPVLGSCNPTLRTSNPREAIYSWF